MPIPVGKYPTPTAQAQACDHGRWLAPADVAAVENSLAATARHSTIRSRARVVSEVPSALAERADIRAQLQISKVECSE